MHKEIPSQWAYLGDDAPDPKPPPSASIPATIVLFGGIFAAVMAGGIGVIWTGDWRWAVGAATAFIASTIAAIGIAAVHHMRQNRE